MSRSSTTPVPTPEDYPTADGRAPVGVSLSATCLHGDPRRRGCPVTIVAELSRPSEEVASALARTLAEATGQGPDRVQVALQAVSTELDVSLAADQGIDFNAFLRVVLSIGRLVERLGDDLVVVEVATSFSM